jgi:hypothetical protein
MSGATPRKLGELAGLFLLRSREASIAIAAIVMIIYQSTALRSFSRATLKLAEHNGNDRDHRPDW